MTPEQTQERAAFEAWYCDFVGVPDAQRENYVARMRANEADEAWQAWIARAQQSAWISVDDRLPELNKEVLVAWTDGVVGRARHINDESEKQTWDIYSSYEQIAYWQPLPEPPQDNTNGSAQ